MTWFGWMVVSLLSIGLLFFSVQLVRDVMWNKKLSTYHKHQGISMPKIPSLYWIKRSYGVVMSSMLVMATVFSGAFTDIPQLDNRVLVNAMSVGSKSKLVALLKNANQNRGNWWSLNDMAEAALDGAPQEKRDYIDTNEQVEGVKEADIVKTDGYTIYYASRYQNRIRVMDVGNDHLVTLRQDIDLGDLYTDSLYLTDDYLIVIGYIYSYFYYLPMIDGDDLIFPSRGYSAFSGAVMVFDRETLALVYQLETNSNFYEHRLIGDSLFLISSQNIYAEDPTPSFKETNDGRVLTSKMSYNDIYYFNDVPATGLTVYTGIKLGDFEVNSKAFIGQVSYIYADVDSLYTFNYYYEYDMLNSSSNEYGQIMQFDLNVETASIDYVGSQNILGSIRSQYWMDEYDGYFRIVTTTWQGAVNRLYILKADAEADVLNVISVTQNGIGKPNETVQSVRFNKNKVNIVTYEQRDPLYTLDLSNPYAPVILPNPIEEPGFNTYMHIWGEDHFVVGLGYDENWGVKLSVYNTNIGFEPLMTYHLTEKDAENWNWSYAEALWNPKSMMIDVDKQIFGFTANTYKYVQVGPENWNYEFVSVFLIFNIDFSKPNDEIITLYQSIQMESTNYYTQIDRGIFIENHIYILSYDYVSVYQLGNNLPIQKILFDNE
jgi:uncharacterized secreted protein with C-terminal beta-propeller domain